MKCENCGEQMPIRYAYCQKCGKKLNAPSNFNNLYYDKIRCYNGKFDLMSGLDFEYYCGILLNEIGFSSIKFTPKSKDHGVDIFAFSVGAEFAIQCKCSCDPIGVSAVRDAFSGKHIYKKDVAIVMTNSNFTDQAKEEANILGVKLWGNPYLSYLTDRYYWGKI